jgi:hypothetical protein
MTEYKYRTHVIKLQANQQPGENYWQGTAQVQYNDGSAFQFFEVHGPTDRFTSRVEAEQHALGVAKKLIDSFI